MDEDCQYAKMNDRQSRYLAAAVDVFVRYGVRRATMGDIAAQAGVSRQTLYASYANKDDILSAAILHLTDQALARIRAGWQDQPDIGKRLDLYFAEAVIAPFEMLQKSPDSGDVISGSNAVTRAAIAQADSAKRTLLLEAFHLHTDAIQRSGQTPAQFAEFVQVCAAGFKVSAVDKPTLLRLLAALKTAVLAVLQP